MQPLRQLAREAVAVGGEALEVRIGRIGAGREVEQVEVPPPECAARSAVIADTMLPAAPVTTKVPPAERPLDAAAVDGGFQQADRPAQPVGVTDLDRAGVAQRLRRSAARPSAAVLRPGSKSTTFTSARSRSRASALQKPLTAPPMTEAAPCSS